MKVIATELADVYILEPQVFGDRRGWFMESWSGRRMEEAGLHYHFAQDNQSFSARAGTLRGLHFQKGPVARQSWSAAKKARCRMWRSTCGRDRRPD